MLKKLSLLALAALIFSGCSRSGKVIQIKGSDTMVNLGQSLAEEFMKENPSISLAVTGGGSGTGIAAIINNTTDIAASSREIKKDEIDKAKSNGIDVNEIHVGNDGIAVISNFSNPINKLTLSQISDIYIGKITNWKELGGPNKKIVILSRERNSGTHVFFLEHIVKLGNIKNPREFAKSTLMMPSTQAIVEETKGNIDAIGYIGLGYLTKDVKAIAVAKDNASKYILPTVANASNKTYPISRPLYFYTKGTPQDQIKAFIDFSLGKKGQQIIIDTGFVPLHK